MSDNEENISLSLVDQKSSHQRNPIIINIKFYYCAQRYQANKLEVRGKMMLRFF